MNELSADDVASMTTPTWEQAKSPNESSCHAASISLCTASSSATRLSADRLSEWSASASASSLVSIAGFHTAVSIP